MVTVQNQKRMYLICQASHLTRCFHGQVNRRKKAELCRQNSGYVQAIACNLLIFIRIPLYIEYPVHTPPLEKYRLGAEAWHLYTSIILSSFCMSFLFFYSFIYINIYSFICLFTYIFIFFVYFQLLIYKWGVRGEYA